MRENEPVLLVFSVCEGEIILEKGEILSEKRHVVVCNETRPIMRQDVFTFDPVVKLLKRPFATLILGSPSI